MTRTPHEIARTCTWYAGAVECWNTCNADRSALFSSSSAANRPCWSLLSEVSRASSDSAITMRLHGSASQHEPTRARTRD
jgi:hypothetical protein